MAKAKEICFECCDNYQKQTYRNRCAIYGAHGKQLLHIPVLKANSKQASKDVKIDQDSPWVQQHLKGIAAAYNSSPFYEFFDVELQELYNSKPTYLLDFNLKCHEFISDAIQLDPSEYQLTEDYQKEEQALNDFRFLVNAKTRHSFNFDAYTQVFSSKHGFIENLSILDLLFAEGGNTLNYLENQQISH